jgi:hypothetical protein
MCYIYKPLEGLGMRKQIYGLVLMVVNALVMPGIARADAKFEQLAKDAIRVGDPAEVAALLWTATVDCTRLTDDMARRECEGVRESRAAKTAGKTFLIEGDSTSFWIGAYDATKKGMPIGVRGCIACGEPVDIGGERKYLVTNATGMTIEGGALKGPEVHKAFRKFPDDASAKKWSDTVVPRLRTQFIFKIPERPAAWNQGGAKGFAVELVAFRVYDPCDGTMVCANPPSEAEKADKAQCKGGDPSNTDIEGDGGKKEPEVVKPVEPVLPDKLDASDVQQAMKKAQGQVDGCYATYGVPGKADLIIEVLGDGTVKNVKLKGEFEDTPTGQCIVDAVKKATFPKFKAPSMSIKYPFILR